MRVQHSYPCPQNGQWADGPCNVVACRAYPKRMVRNIRRGEHYEVYIGRAGHGMDGYFGNPFKSRHPEINITQFRKYAEGRVEHDAHYRAAVAGLHGKALGCFCAPGPCHGDVLVELAAELHEEDAALAWEAHDFTTRQSEFLGEVFKAIVGAGAEEIELPAPEVLMEGYEGGPREKIVLGTGGRTFGVPPKDVTTVAEVIKARKEKAALFAVLDEENPDIIIEGGANGADRRFREWGEAHGKDVWTYPAPWEEFKAAGDPNWKRAGTERNWKMADVLATEREKGHDCLVIACPGGTGTQSMKDISNLFQFYIREVEV